VAKGTDIENAKDLFKHVGEKVSNVKLYFIDNVSIESITFPNSLKYIKGTIAPLTNYIWVWYYSI
jgi:hypothetical protein